ncbi:hypothetical protein BDP27DRAFT_1413592 [Rhodocollybia butyracea]|uniref:F-box domain-containing protein n=1 Tax=Rhodocollybia butyracea TaxID=206335 RepID=A0A9P5Q8Y6_9AGAR|nr:hypothetical protein BDP27DRAFT_1413592 [Rhodocollybia butyracea]
MVVPASAQVDKFNFDIRTIPKTNFVPKQNEDGDLEYATANVFEMETWMDNPETLLHSIARLGVKTPVEEVAPDAKPLPLAKFSDFGVLPDEIPEQCRDREYITIVKRWVDVGRKFELVYAITTPSMKLVRPKNYTPHIPLVIITIHPVSDVFIPHKHTWTLSGELCLKEPFEEVVQKGYAPETHTFFRFENVVISPECRTRVALCSPGEYRHEDLSSLPKSLMLYHSTFNHHRYHMNAAIIWYQSIIWQPNFRNIMLILRTPELLALICKTLDMRSLQSFRATSKYFFDALACFPALRLRAGLSRVFNNAHLTAFQVLLQSTASVVGGSFALSLLYPGNWQPADLDIVAEESQTVQVRQFLVQKCRFKRDDERSQNIETFYPGLDRTVFKFQYEHYTNPIVGRPGVDLITVFKNSIPADFVLTYHSTVVMNLWDGKHLYCLWPDLTFTGLYVRNWQTLTKRMDKALQKYWARGFRDKYDPQGVLLHDTLDDIPEVEAHHIQDDLSAESRPIPPNPNEKPQRNRKKNPATSSSAPAPASAHVDVDGDETMKKLEPITDVLPSALQQNLNADADDDIMIDVDEPSLPNPSAAPASLAPVSADAIRSTLKSGTRRIPIPT